MSIGTEVLKRYWVFVLPLCFFIILWEESAQKDGYFNSYLVNLFMVAPADQFILNAAAAAHKRQTNSMLKNNKLRG